MRRGTYSIVARDAHSGELAPEADELTFWTGVGIAKQDLGAGLALVRRAAASKPSWTELLERLPPELAPSGAALQRALRGEPLPRD